MSRSVFQRISVLGVTASLTVFGVNSAQAQITTPSAVGALTATASDGKVTATWSRPGGGGTMTYTATLTPSGKKCTTTSLTCTFTGLTNGTAYTVSVRAKNTKGTGAASSKSAIPSGSTLTITGTLQSAFTKLTGGNCSTISLSSKDACGLRVVAILPNGQLFTSTPDGSAIKFKIVVKASIAKRAKMTLHLIRGNGAYVGPVVLSSANSIGKTGMTSYANTADLGLVTLKSVSSKTAYATAQKAPGAVLVGTGVRLVNGAPTGAGKAGFVARTTGPQLHIQSMRSGGGLRLFDGPQSCASFANNPDTNAMSSACWDDLAGGMTGFSANCPKVSTANKNKTQWSTGCRNWWNSQMGSGGSNNGGGSGGGSQDPCASATIGGDSDGDGLPDAIDVDDNGDLVVDTTDPSANNGCSLEPYKSIRSELGNGVPLNYGTVVNNVQSDEAFNAAVNNFLGGSNFAISYYAYRPESFPNAKLVNGLIPAVWVSCDGVIWCDPATSRAVNGINIEMNNYGNEVNTNPNGQNASNFSFEHPANANGFTGGSAAWRSAPCSDGQQGPMAPCWGEMTRPLRFETSNSNCDNGGVTVPYVKDYLPTGLPTNAKNFLWQTVCHSTSQGGRDRTVLGAGITPLTNNLAVNTDGDSTNNVLAQNAISPNDVLNLNYLDSAGSVNSIASTLGAYPITAPMVTKFTTGGQDFNTIDTSTHTMTDVGTNQHAVTVAADGNLTLTFLRPQRQTLPGEAGDTSGYRDLFGLNYGLQIEAGGAQFGCGEGQAATYDPNAQNVHAVGTNKYSNINGNFTRRDSASNDSTSGYLAPLTDTASGFVPFATAGSQTLSFTVNLKECLAERASWLSATYWNGNVPSLNQWRFNLVARGEDKTGGTDSALQSFNLDISNLVWR